MAEFFPWDRSGEDCRELRAFERKRCFRCSHSHCQRHRAIAVNRPKLAIEDIDSSLIGRSAKVFKQRIAENRGVRCRSLVRRANLAVYFGLAGPHLDSFEHFLTVTLNFLIIAWALFAVIKGINTLKKEEPAPPTPGSSEEVKLMTSIRDLLKQRS